LPQDELPVWLSCISHLLWSFPWPSQFVSFLRHQRARALGVHTESSSLPPWLLRRLDAYLPVDPAAMLGFGARVPDQCSAEGFAAGFAEGLAEGRCDGIGGRLPIWLHGDLT
jgi:hypothetical protein